jgi:hypothetical protein
MDSQIECYSSSHFGNITIFIADEHHSSLGPETLHFDDSTHPMKLQTQPTISEGFGRRN